MRLKTQAAQLSIVAFIVLAGIVDARGQGGTSVTVGPAVGNPIPPLTTVDAEFGGTFRKFAATDGLQLLVVGKSSANIVRFDLATGAATVVAKLANGSSPWSLAVSDSGEIFVGLRGGKKNIVRLVPGPTGDPNGPLVPVDLTGTMGKFGPGLMAFDGRGLLNVAGDTNRAVHRYDVTTGKLVESMRLRAANLVGLTLSGDHLYAAEYFQKTILRFDLDADPAQGAKFIYKSEHLDIPHGMTIGHNGNLFVSSLRSTRVQEFSGESGEFIRTFVDVRTLGAGKIKDLHFEPQLKSYFMSADDAVFVLSPDGTLLAKYANKALSDAVAIAVVPRARPVAAASADLTSGDGLIGYATIRGTHVPVALRYQHGKVFQPASLVGTVTEAGQTPRDVKVIFRGSLHVPKPMTVKVFVAGGSSNGGHCWLQLADLRAGPLGDDHEKNESQAIRMEAGEHPVEWTLTGGDLGCGLLKFIDAETLQLLPLTFTRADQRDVTVNTMLQVSSDEPGWPVIAEWIDTTTKAWDFAAGLSTSAASNDQLRLRVFTGDPAVTTVGGNKLVLEKSITIEKPFEFQGEYSLVVAGLVSRNDAGKLHFKGSVQHNAGFMEYDSAAILGEGIRARGGGFSGGFVLWFVQLDHPLRSSPAAD